MKEQTALGDDVVPLSNSLGEHGEKILRRGFKGQ